MATLSNLSIIIHITAGVLTLLTGPIAIFTNNRNTRLHRIVGKTFFIAMNIVCISAIIGFFKHPNQGFYQFLLGISVLVYAAILRGVRAIQMMKGGTIKTFDFMYSAILGCFAVWMLGMSLYNFKQGIIPFAILFFIFGLGAADDTFKNFKIYSKPEKLTKTEWLWTHVHSMLGAFMASTTAFTVNTAHYLPWYIQWFGPTLILLPLQFYWSRKLKPKQATTEIIA